MKRREYSWRHTRAVSGGLVRDARRNEVLGELLRIGPSKVYAGCLDFAIRSGSQKAAGYAAHLFREVFGTWPRPQDRIEPEPLPDFLIEEWVAGRKRKTPAKRRAA
jgi:hypothetical protein